MTFRRRRASYTSNGASRNTKAICIREQEEAAEFKLLTDAQLAIAGAASFADADEELAIHVSQRNYPRCVLLLRHRLLFFLIFVDVRWPPSTCPHTHMPCWPNAVSCSGGYVSALRPHGGRENELAAHHRAHHHQHAQRCRTVLRNRLPLPNAGSPSVGLLQMATAPEHAPPGTGLCILDLEHLGTRVLTSYRWPFILSGYTSTASSTWPSTDLMDWCGNHMGTAI